MEVATKFPITALERAELGPELVRFPGSWDEFWELLDEAEYSVEFKNNEIITAMSWESDPHSHIANMIGTLFNMIFMDDDSIRVFNSNRPIYIRESGAVYNPDMSVVREPSIKYEYRPGLNAETTPIIVVEVLSKSTRDHDLEEKLPDYKTIPGLEHIIYIENFMPYVTVFSRNLETGKWTNIVYDELDSGFEIAGQPITLRQIYRKVQFVKKPRS